MNHTPAVGGSGKTTTPQTRSAGWGLPSGGVVFAIGGGSGAQSWVPGAAARAAGTVCRPRASVKKKPVKAAKAVFLPCPRRVCHRWGFAGFATFTTFSPGHLKNLSEASTDHCGGERVFSQLPIFSDLDKSR